MVFFYVGVSVVFIGNNQPTAEGLVFAGIAVDFDAHVHVLAVGFFLGSSREGEFKGLEYDFRFNVFFHLPALRPAVTFRDSFSRISK